MLHHAVAWHLPYRTTMHHDLLCRVPRALPYLDLYKLGMSGPVDWGPAASALLLPSPSFRCIIMRLSRGLWRWAIPESRRGAGGLHLVVGQA